MRDKSTRELWAESFGRDYELWLLAEHGDIRKYETKAKLDDNPRVRRPVFHVWDGDKWLYCGHSMQEMETVYRNAMKRKGECNTGV